MHDVHRGGEKGIYYGGTVGVVVYMNVESSIMSGNSLIRTSALGVGGGAIASSLSLRESYGILHFWFTRPG